MNASLRHDQSTQSRSTQSQSTQSRSTQSQSQSTQSRQRPGCRDESGQATAEYALVMLAAAALAGLLLAWASSTDGIGRLLDAVMKSLISQVG